MPVKSKKVNTKKNSVKKTPAKKTQVKKNPIKKMSNIKSKEEDVVEAVVEAVVVKAVVEAPPEPSVVEAPPEPSVVEAPPEPSVVEVVVEAVVEAVVDEVSEIDKMKEELNKIQEYISNIGNLTFDYMKKHLQKDLSKMSKNSLNICHRLEKEYNKATKKKTKRAQSHGTGFEKKVNISDNFRKFIIDTCGGVVGEDNKISRKEGSNYIHTYIKNNNIQKPECKRHLSPNKALQSILSPLSSEVNEKTGKKDIDIGYTYFNLQKYIKGCYISSQ